jgi:hypothetical protein
MRRILCLFGLHKRSRGAASSQGPAITSICKYCGAPMTKVRGRWQADRDKAA